MTDASIAATPVLADMATARAADTTASGTDTAVFPAAAGAAFPAAAAAGAAFPVSVGARAAFPGAAGAEAVSPVSDFLSGVLATAIHSGYASIYRSAAVVWVSSCKQTITAVT
jgi:hypothetical protein